MKRSYLALLSVGGAIAVFAGVGVILLLRRSTTSMTAREIESIRATLNATTAVGIGDGVWDLIPSASPRMVPPPSENALAIARGMAIGGGTPVVWSNLQRMFVLDASSAERLDGTYVAPGVTFVSLPRSL